MAKQKELLNKLLKDVKSSMDLLGKGGLLNQSWSKAG